MPTTPKKYRRQVELVEGFQYTSSNAQDVVDFAGGFAYLDGGKLFLSYPGGGQAHEMQLTDWILLDQWKAYFSITDAQFQIIYAPGP